MYPILQFLFEVTQHVSVNKMDAKNLAIVMAPNLIPVSGNDSEFKTLLDRNVEVIEVCTMLFKLNMHYEARNKYCA